MQQLRRWLLARDPGLRATRRAARTAVVMPALFALGSRGLGDTTVATFAAFGAFAVLLLADFGGTTAERLSAQAALVGSGAVLVCLGTLASRDPWAAAAATLVVGFAVLFVGVVSSVLAGASTAVLLGFVLPVTAPAPASAIPERLAGWLLAGLVSLPAVALLWPAPRSEPLRDAAGAALRALAGRLTAETAARAAGTRATQPADDVAAAAERADRAVAQLRTVFLATPYRPAGLTAATRGVVRLVDQVVWLSAVLDDVATTRAASAAASHSPADPAVCAVERAAAVLLEHSGRALGDRDRPQDSVQDHLDDLQRARWAMEAAVTTAVAQPAAGAPAAADRTTVAAGLVAGLAPAFRAQEVSSAVAAIAGTVEATTAAERRPWVAKLLGRPVEGLGGPLASARERALAHAEPHSVWLHNSVRGAVALAGAVLVADLSGVQHSFWVVLGALSVLRSNALSTGQNALRGLAGTVAGFVVGGALVLALGSSTPVLWGLLPVAILVAGVAPAVSFAAGQAGFTVTLLVLFNIASPAGWQVGLVRVEDVGIGCGVSLVVGALFWPRGAAAALARALSEAYAAAAGHLRAAAETGATGGSPAATADAALRAAAAARRLDDAFREFLAERGPKRLALPEVTTLLTGVAGLRLTADAVAELWPPGPAAPDGPADAPRAHAEVVAATERVTGWYAALALAFLGTAPVPVPLPRDEGADGRLVEALRRDLDDAAAPGPGPRAVRLVWTGDHVDAARRLQTALQPPARAALQPPARAALPGGAPDRGDTP